MEEWSREWSHPLCDHGSFGGCNSNSPAETENDSSFQRRYPAVAVVVAAVVRRTFLLLPPALGCGPQNSLGKDWVVYSHSSHTARVLIMRLRPQNAAANID